MSTKVARKTPRRASIEPRLRERRVAVIRARGRRRLRWLVAVVVLGILAAAAWLVTQSPLLDVDRIRVTGVHQATAEQVRLAAGVHRGDPLLFVDSGAVEGRVERVPWVDRAHVERRISGDVDIRVTERQPAVWARRAPDRVALIDDRGRVLSDAPNAPAELPELDGVATIPPPGRRVTPAGAVGVLDELPAELRSRTARVVAGGGAVTLALRDGPEVRLGPPDDVAAKARVALAVLGAANPPPAYVDVRVPTAPVTG